jgi:hypothetical protein
MLNEAQDENSVKTKQWIEVILADFFTCLEAELLFEALGLSSEIVGL